MIKSILLCFSCPLRYNDKSLVSVNCLIFRNGVRYRARVLNTDLIAQQHKVYLVDTGSVVTTADVWELPAIFYDIPAQVISLVWLAEVEIQGGRVGMWNKWKGH